MVGAQARVCSVAFGPLQVSSEEVDWANERIAEWKIFFTVAAAPLEVDDDGAT